MKRITLVCECSGHLGYGQHATQLVRQLQRLGWFVSIRALRINERPEAKIPPNIKALVVQCAQPDDEWEVLLSPPGVMPTPGRRTLAFSMWESTQLPSEHVAFFNMASAVVVPCRWNKDSFEQSGVKVPIHICPLGVDTTIFQPTDFPNWGPFVFGAAGRLTNGPARKGVQESIAAFFEEFKPEEKVRLKIKVFEDDPVFRSKDPRIEYETRCLNDSEMARWFNSIHVFACPAKAEGWGLMHHQAMSCGRPVIAAPYSGLAEFFDQSCGWALPYVEGSALDIWDGHGNWCYPDFNALKKSMREAFENQEEVRIRGALARDIACSFSWDHSGDVFGNILDKVMADPSPVRIESFQPIHTASFPRLRPSTWDARIWDSVYTKDEYHCPKFNAYDLVIDIGCHIGAFSRRASDNGSRMVLAFDPDYDNTVMTSWNNGEGTGVCVYKLAVWRSDIKYTADTTLPFTGYSDDKRNTGGGNTVFKDGDGIDVFCTSLDRIVCDHSVRFLKLDCESSEWPILYTSKKLAQVEEIAGEFHEIGGKYDQHTIPESAKVGDRKFTMPALAEFLHEQGFTVDWAYHKPGSHIGTFRARRTKHDDDHKTSNDKLPRAKESTVPDKV